MERTVARAQIRRLRPSDIANLTALSTRLGAEDAPDWARRFASADSVILGAELEGALVGYAAGEVRRSFGLPALAGWVDAFGIDITRRGHGAGRELASAFLAELRSRGADHVFTLVPVHDRALDPFFRDLGFHDEPLLCLGRAL